MCTVYLPKGTIEKLAEVYTLRKLNREDRRYLIYVERFEHEPINQKYLQSNMHTSYFVTSEMKNRVTKWR